MAEAYQQGCSLFVDEAYEEALVLFTNAIASDPQNAEYHVKRSACHAKLRNFTDSLADANTAIGLDPHNATAYLRKGIACFELEEYETAKIAFETGHKLKPDDNSFKTWIRKCEAEISDTSDIEEDDLVERETEPNATSEQPPSQSKTSVSTTSSSSIPAPSQNTEGDAKENIANCASPPPIVGDGAPKQPSVRHSWYQNENYVYVTFYAKDLQQQDVETIYEPKALEVTLKLSGSNSFVFDQQLCDEIIPQECRVTINKTNVEIRLKKARSGHWPTLENAGGVIAQWPDTSGADKRVYPSSSKKKKDWDAIASSMEEDKLEGEQALAKVFQDIYGKGSEEQRRAMIKSFVESGGTVLSTNWEEVGKGAVKGSPPKGLEMRKYGE